jgi:hypothetical protein
MRHFNRMTLWNKPKRSENWENSMADAYVSMPAGNMLAYRMEKPSQANGQAPTENRMATAIAARLGGALVQWPTESCNGNQRLERVWIYAIQKPGVQE